MGLIISPYQFGGLVWVSSSYAALTAEGTAYSGYTSRQRINAVAIPALGNWVRFTFQGGTSEGLTVTNCYIGIAGANEQFSVTPTQAFFNGGSAGFAIGIGASQVSDPVALTIGSGQNIIIASYTAAGNTTADNYGRSAGAVTGCTQYYKLANDAATVSTSGYTNNGSALYISKLEVAA